MRVIGLSRNIWLALASLSTACALIRYFDLSAIVYNVCYALLALIGAGIAIYLALQARRLVRIDGTLFAATLAPSFLLFVDLSSDWRVVCLFVIALVAVREWKTQRVVSNIG